jgi:hypothetical protein
LAYRPVADVFFDALIFGVPKLCLDHIYSEVGKRCKYLIY